MNVLDIEGLTLLGPERLKIWNFGCITVWRFRFLDYERLRKLKFSVFFKVWLVEFHTSEMLKVKKGKIIIGTKSNVVNCCAKRRTDKFFKESVLYFFLRLTRETFWDEKTTKRELSFQGAAILKTITFFLCQKQLTLFVCQKQLKNKYLFPDQDHVDPFTLSI